MTNQIHDFSEDGVDKTRRSAVIGGAATFGLVSTRLLAGCGGGASSPSGAAPSPSSSGTPTPTGTSTGGTPPPTTSSGSLYDGSIAVSGSNLVNGAGKIVQLRGMNLGNYSSPVILNENQPAGAEDLSGGTWVTDQANGPNLNYLAKWKTNVVRIGAPDASWLGYTCFSPAVNGDGSTGWINPDPHGTFKAQFIKMVADLNAIGCYVTIVVAFANPGRSATLGQDTFANQDNDIQMWNSLAQTFGYPNGTALKRNGGTVDDRSVIFELFNEPEPYGDSAQNWGLLMNGGFYNQPYNANPGGQLGAPYKAIFPFPCNVPTGTFVPGESVTISGGITGKVLCYYLNTTTGLPSSGTKFIHLYDLSSTSISAGATVSGSKSGASTTITSSTFGYFVAGHAQMLAAIRATGAENVCLLSGLNYNQDLELWADYAPSDSTPPNGYSGAAWKPQIGACWHPYPSWSWIGSATVQNGGEVRAGGGV